MADNELDSPEANRRAMYKILGIPDPDDFKEMELDTAESILRTVYEKREHTLVPKISIEQQVGIPYSEIQKAFEVYIKYLYLNNKRDVDTRDPQRPTLLKKDEKGTLRLSLGQERMNTPPHLIMLMYKSHDKVLKKPGKIAFEEEDKLDVILSLTTPVEPHYVHVEDRRGNNSIIVRGRHVATGEDADMYGPLINVSTEKTDENIHLGNQLLWRGHRLLVANMFGWNENPTIVMPEDLQTSLPPPQPPNNESQV